MFYRCRNVVEFGFSLYCLLGTLQSVMRGWQRFHAWRVIDRMRKIEITKTGSAYLGRSRAGPHFCQAVFVVEDVKICKSYP